MALEMPGLQPDRSTAISVHTTWLIETSCALPSLLP
jgi:hypothetical protein